jgi:hypothetical protein
VIADRAAAVESLRNGARAAAADGDNVTRDVLLEATVVLLVQYPTAVDGWLDDLIEACVQLADRVVESTEATT